MHIKAVSLVFPIAISAIAYEDFYTSIITYVHTQNSIKSAVW